MSEQTKICRICERPLRLHSGADLDRCERDAEQGEVLRRLTDEVNARRQRQEIFLERHR